MSVFLWSNNFWGYFSSLNPHLKWNNLTSVPTQCNQYNLVNILQSSGLKVSMIFVCYLGKYNFPRTSGRTNIFTRILFLCFFKYKMKINSFLSLGVISHIHFGKVTISHLNSCIYTNCSWIVPEKWSFWSICLNILDYFFIYLIFI